MTLDQYYDLLGYRGRITHYYIIGPSWETIDALSYRRWVSRHHHTLPQASALIWLRYRHLLLFLSFDSHHDFSISWCISHYFICATRHATPLPVL
jgi:hypothetical protein